MENKTVVISHFVPYIHQELSLTYREACLIFLGEKEANALIWSQIKTK